MLAATIVASAAPGLAQDAPNGPTTSPAAAPVITTVEQDIEYLGRQLLDGPDVATREEAARRLLQRSDQRAQELVLQALGSFNNRDAQLAAARALPSAQRANPVYIDALFALLGNNRVLNDAASTALGMYKGSQRVLGRLVDLSRPGADAAVRTAAIRSLGMLVEKDGAEALMMVLTNASEPAALRDAAADALVNMTGLYEYGRSAERWFQWWGANATRNAGEWKLLQLEQRAARYDRTQLLYDRLAEENRVLLDEQVRSLPARDKAPVLMRLLNSSSPAIRAHAAEIVGRQLLAAWPAPPEVRDQLRSMIGDSDANVRARVTQTIFLTADPQAVSPLLVQLQQENDPNVRREIIITLAKIRDLRAVAELRRMLSDDSTAVAAAAADGLREFGPILRDRDPAVAREVALQLRDVLNTDRRATEDRAFRESLVRAMVSTREMALRQTLIDLLAPTESVEVRRTVIEGMGQMNVPQFADLVVERLDDPSESIRRAAARALTTLAQPAHAASLYPRLTSEPSEAVRDEVWNVLLSLFPTMSEENLREASEKFAGQPERKVHPQQALVELLMKDPRRGNDLALERMNLAEIYMALNQPDKAVVQYRAAFTFFAQRGQGMVTAQLTEGLLRALLSDKSYAAAVDFSTERIREDQGMQENVGVILASEAERLVQSGDYRNAVALVEETRKMTPPLAPRFMGRLEASEAEARRHLPQRGATAPGTAAPTETQPAQ